MGFRLRKSIRIAPGVRLSVSRRGVGASIGAPSARASVHSTGRRTTTLGSGIVPGVYYQTSASGHGRRTRGTAKPAAPAPRRSVRAIKPGLFAPRGEKALYTAVQRQDVPAIRAVGERYPAFRVVAYAIAGLWLMLEENAEAERLLSDVFTTGRDPALERFLRSYELLRVELPIARGVTAELTINRAAVGLALAELKQLRGDVAGAIDVVEQLEPTTYSAVSLAELYAAAERWDDVIELTNGLANADDASALLLVFRGEALHGQGLFDAAHVALTEALRSKSRADDIRLLALYERARNLISQGKRALARKDLERIIAQNADYADVRAQLEALAH